MPKEAKILLAIGVIIILGGAALAKFKSGPTYTPPADPGLLVREESRMTGSMDAKVTMVEFGDYQCPFCAQFNPMAKQIVAEYGDNPGFNFVYRHFPLPQHQHAKSAAQAAEAAGAQGKFWEMHNLLFDRQNEWVAASQPLDAYTAYAQELELDIDKFREDVQRNAYEQAVQTDLADGREIGVNSTPTVYINGQKITGGFSYENIKSQIDAALAQE